MIRILLHFLLSQSSFKPSSFFFNIYLIDYAIMVVSFFSPLYSLLPCTALPPVFPHLSSCPWVIHINSLASPFPILFITSPYLFCTCHLYCFPVPLSLVSPLPLSSDNLPCDLHFYDSVVFFFIF